MKTLLLLLMMLLFITGCSTKNLSPESVTKYFWQAQQQQRVEEAKKFTVKEDTEKTTLYEKIKIKSVDFGEVKESDTKASVATKLYLKDDEVPEIDFLTKLDKTDKGWRVNMSDTKRSLYVAIGKQYTGSFGDILKDSLEGMESLKELFGDFFESFKTIIENNQGTN